MHCPECGEHMRMERERDGDAAFNYYVCPECGFDDYEEQQAEAMQLDFNED